MNDTIWQINSFLQDYIDERYNDLVEELLSRELKDFHNLSYRLNGINFNNMFDELIFVTLYESNFFNELQQKIGYEIYDMLEGLSQNEINLLLLKDINPLDSIEEKGMEFIVTEMFTVINDKLVEYLSNLSNDKYSLFTTKLIDGIKDFAFNSSVAGDYNTSNYWEEYCLILQEGYDILYDICYGDIYNYIISELNKSSNPDLCILYSSTDDIYVEHYNNPFSSIDVYAIVEKLYDLINTEAALENIDHCLYPDEYNEEIDEDS